MRQHVVAFAVAVALALISGTARGQNRPAIDQGAMKVGDAGRLDSLGPSQYRMTVAQVFEKRILVNFAWHESDDPEFYRDGPGIVHIQGGRIVTGAEARAVHMADARNRHPDGTFFLEGIETKGMVSDARWEPSPDDTFKVTGTETYKTVAGGTRTVFVLSRIGRKEEQAVEKGRDPSAGLPPWVRDAVESKPLVQKGSDQFAGLPEEVAKYARAMQADEARVPEDLGEARAAVANLSEELRAAQAAVANQKNRLRRAPEEPRAMQEFARRTPADLLEELQPMQAAVTDVSGQLREMEAAVADLSGQLREMRGARIRALCGLRAPMKRAPMRVGDIGRFPCFQRTSVVQVFENKILVRYDWGGATHGQGNSPDVTGLIFVKGIETKGIVSDAKWQPSPGDIFEVAGTETYETVAGGSNTVFALSKVRADRIQAYVQARAEENRAKEEKAQEEARNSRDAEKKAEEEQKANAEKARWRTWTDADGASHFEARMNGIINGNVVLRKRDGTAARVPLKNLSPDDRQWVEQWKALRKKPQ